MREFRDKVAVVTGAASGIGRALALEAAAAGMRVVLADIERRPLRELERELEAAGTEVLALRTDVSRKRDVARLARRTRSSFGGAHLLFSNAGVGVGAAVWAGSVSDWEWVLGVNLWGTVHALREFVPMMLAQGTECHIVNTASALGVLTAPGLGAYCAAKHAVVALSECLYQELNALGSRIGVSVLLPGFVKTRILEAERNRPLRLRLGRRRPPRQGWHEEGGKAWRGLVEQGMDAGEVARMTFAAVSEGRFYIFTHPALQGLLEERLEDLRQARNPSPYSFARVIAALGGRDTRGGAAL